MTKKKKDNIRIGYMDKIDFESLFDVGSSGVKVYFSITDLRNNQKCVFQCGEIEVEIRLRKVIRDTYWEAEV